MSLGLSDPEREALQLAAEGLTCREMARELGRALETVKHHRKSAIAKLGARNMPHAVYLATAGGIIDNSRATESLDGFDPWWRRA